MDFGKIIRAQWCVDSETGEELLVNLETNKVMAKRDKDGIIYNPPEQLELPLDYGKKEN